MAAYMLRRLCRLRLGLLAAPFSQRAAAGTEYRSAYSLDKLYPPRRDEDRAGTASAPVSGGGAGGERDRKTEGRGLPLE